LAVVGGAEEAADLRNFRFWIALVDG